MSTIIINSYMHGGIDPDAATWIGAMAVAPDSARRALYNDLFVDWKLALGVSSLSQAVDACYCHAAHAEQAGLLNMAKRAHDCTPVNSPAFTADRGYARDVSGYLNTNYNPSLHSVAYTLNSAALTIYSRTDANEATVDFGAQDTTARRAFMQSRVSGVFAAPLNQGSSGGTVATVADSLAMISVDRSASNLRTGYQRGGSVGTNATASSDLPNQDFFVLAMNNGGSVGLNSSRQLAMTAVTRSLTAAEHLATYTIWQQFFTAIGAAI